MNLPEQYATLLAQNPELAARRERYLPLVQAAAAKYGIPPGLLDFTLLQESRYQPHVIGDNGQSIGIAQIQAATARGLGVDPSQLTNPEVAIDAAAKYLAPLWEQSGGDWGAARLGYNRGPAAERALLSGGPLPSTVGKIALNNIAGAREYQRANMGPFANVQSAVKSTAPDATPAKQDIEPFMAALGLPVVPKDASIPKYASSPVNGNGTAVPVESGVPTVRIPPNAVAFQPTAFRDWFSALGL